MRRTGTSADRGVVVPICNFDTTAFVDGMTHVSTQNGTWTR